ncbi:twin-arginine translocation signal domain-containing protein [Thermocatellispora tengchongensis]
MNTPSRRDFLRLGGAAAATATLASCGWGRSDTGTATTGARAGRR